jgi:hypothetical protein
LNEGGTWLAAVRKPDSKPQRGRPQKRGDKPPSTGNKLLTRQIRKILGKHYANKYRVR